MMNVKNTKSKGQRSSLSKQIVALIVLAGICLALVATLVTVNYITGIRKFVYEGETYYIMRQKDDKGQIVYSMTDKNKTPLLKTEDGYFVTNGGTLISIDQKTGLANEYMRPDTEGNEQVGVNDRILIFPYTPKDKIQSIEIHNSKGSFSFYRMRTYEDTDKKAYVCILRNGEYHLLDEDGNEIKGHNGIFKLTSGNEISIDKDTGFLIVEKYVDFDGNIYSVKQFEFITTENGVDVKNREYRLVDSNGNEVKTRITKYGEKTDKDGNKYDALLYDYYVTSFGTLINVDKNTGSIASFAVREYNETKEIYATYHFLLRNDKFIMCNSKGEIIHDTAVDDKDYYRTGANAYLAFNEENGTYSVRIMKNIYLVCDNDGVYSLYNKGKVCHKDGTGFYPLPNKAYLNFDPATGSHSTMEFDGESYKEKDAKYLNNFNVTDTKGEFVIENFETTEYDPSLFAALAVSSGYTLTSAGGKLSTPILLKDKNGNVLKNANGKEMIDFAQYGLAESDNPAYCILKDLDGNVHKLSIGNKIVSNAGFYIKYSSLDDDGNFVERQAVYILLDNYSTGYTKTYEVFYYYSISDTLLAPVESLITPKALYPAAQNSYFDVRDFTIFKYNPDKSSDNILNDDPKDDEDYYDVFVQFTYQDIEERRNTALSAFPYIMGDCLLKAYNINSFSVDICLQTLKDLKIKSVSHIGVNDRDLVNYGLDVPEYIISFKSPIPELNNQITSQMLLISSLTPNGTYYIYSEIYDMIVEVKKENFDFISWSSVEWVTNEIYDIGVAFTDRMRIESGEYFADFDISMIQTLSAKIKTDGSSNYSHTVKVSDDRKDRLVTIYASMLANINKSAANVELLQVKLSTLDNYFIYATTKSTSHMTVEEEKELKEFTKTIHQSTEKNGDAMTAHAMTLTDNKGNTHEVTLYFMFTKDGEVTASVSVNKESPWLVFSKKAYLAYEKVMYGDKDLTAEQKKTAFDFYLAPGVSANATYEFDKIEAFNSFGEKTVFSEMGITMTDKAGNVNTNYALGKKYKLVFELENGDLIGIGSTWIRYYDMSDKDTTENGKYQEINDEKYSFKAIKSQMIKPENGKNLGIKEATLGEGNFDVQVSKEYVTITDQSGNVYKYLRYAGTSPFSSFYSSILWASYEGFCDIPKEQKDAFKALDDSKCQMKLSITTKNGDNYVFRTYKYSERRAYITANGEGEFFVLRSFIDKIIQNSSIIFSGINFSPTNKY